MHEKASNIKNQAIEFLNMVYLFTVTECVRIILLLNWYRSRIIERNNDNIFDTILVKFGKVWCEFQNIKKNEMNTVIKL